MAFLLAVQCHFSIVEGLRLGSEVSRESCELR